MQFPFDPFAHDVWQLTIPAVHGLSGVPGQAPNIIGRRGNDRWKRTIRERLEIGVDQVGNGLWLGDHHVAGNGIAQVGKLRQHLAGGAQVQVRLVSEIGIPVVGQQDSPEFGVFTLQKVDVAGGTDRFSSALAKGDDQAVQMTQVFFRIQAARFLAQIIAVIGNRLDFEIIVKARFVDSWLPPNPVVSLSGLRWM